MWSMSPSQFAKKVFGVCLSSDALALQTINGLFFSCFLLCVCVGVVVIPKHIPAEPKTYANLFKSAEVSSGISFASAMSSNAPSLGSTTAAGQARYGVRPTVSDTVRPSAGVTATEPMANVGGTGVQSSRSATIPSRPVRRKCCQCSAA